jgi:exopolysaccharide biosynthesis polyprenyl glycosylphosphotransferase
MRRVRAREPWDNREGSAVDLDHKLQPASEVAPDTLPPRTKISQSLPAWPLPLARPVLPVYSVEERLRRQSLRRASGKVLLFLLDAVALNLAFIVAYLLRFDLLNGVRITTPFINEPLSAFRQLEIVITIGLLLLFWMQGLYRLRATGSWFKQFWTIASATTIGFALFTAFEYIFRDTDLLRSQNRAIVTFTWITIIILVSLLRLVVSGILGLLYRRGIGLTNLIVVGSGRLGKLMMQQVAASPYLGYRVVGFIHDMDGPPSDFGRFKALGVMSELDQVIRGNRVTEVIIALPSHQHKQILRTVSICERAGANFKLVPDLYELSLSRIDVDAIEGVPLIGLKRSLKHTWQYRVKRMIDCVGALALLVISTPVWLLIALAIKLDSPGPVLLRQTRLGYRGEPFECFKFRSMYANADQMADKLRSEVPPADERGKFKIRHDPRRTRVGSIIRSVSIDELPQILNVIKGDMSLVGPRPPLPSEYERYEDWEKARLELPPGMTGLWQVRGRSDIDFNEMVLMDLYYIENWSLRLDFQILLQTIPAVLSRRGAY